MKIIEFMKSENVNENYVANDVSSLMACSEKRETSEYTNDQSS